MRYIVATDGSDASLRAARFVVEHSCPDVEDEVFVVYVFPLPADLEIYADVVDLPTEAADPRVVKVAQPILERSRAVIGSGTRVYDAVLVGNPAKEIVEFATNMQANLIVAGTSDRTSASELYLGSVCNALIHHARCSVLIVR